MHRTNSHRLLNISLAILLLVVVGGAYVVTRGNGDTGSTGDVVTATVARGTVRSTVSASATVEAPQDLGLNFTTAGTISSLDVEVGDKVHAGQIVGSRERHVVAAEPRGGAEQPVVRPSFARGRRTRSDRR